MRAALAIFFLSLIQIGFSQFISSAHAQEDLMEFKGLLETQSSYFQLSDADWELYFRQLSQEIESRDSVSIPFLAFEMEKGIAKTRDRHANIRMDDFEEDDVELFNLHFPFFTAPLDGKAAALQYKRAEKAFDYYDPKYPFVKRINGMEVKDFLAKYAYRRNNCPAEARLQSGLRDLRKMGELYYKQGEFEQREVEVEFTNGKRDKTMRFPLSERKHTWFDVGSYSSDIELMMRIWQGKPVDFQKLHKWLGDSIAYLGIPEMVSYEDYPELEGFLDKAVQSCQGAKALILDLRGNGGGTREILMTLSKYLVPPGSSPWVANVAYVRSDQYLDEDIESMEDRFLFNADSDQLSEEAKEAVEEFAATFESDSEVDPKKFSAPYYMVLESGPNTLKCPVYILVNEECFSAASVFAAAFKGLPNVKLAGVRTNGSSGRSRKFYLKHSKIRVKLSTMVSLQRNGKTLDGNGTEPDILIPREESQVLGKKDGQLERLIALIKEKG